MVFRHARLALALAGLLSSLTAASAAELWVAPDGQADGAGTKDSPVSFQRAVATKLAPGTTVYLRGGTYLVRPEGYDTHDATKVKVSAVPNITWQGTAEAPIVLRSAPGEWARFDGGLDVRGNATYVVLRDFEITRTEDYNILDPNWWNLPVNERPSYSGAGANLKFAIDKDLISLYDSDHVSLINLYVHDNVSGGGFGLWGPAQNTLIYGNLLIRNGWEDKGRGHGHGCYIQNGWPERYKDSVKTFKHNVAALNQASGMKSYGQNPDVIHTHFYENSYFGNGLRSWTNGSANYLGGTYKLLDDVILDGNHFYQPDKTTGDVGGTVYLGWGGKDKGTIQFTNNHVYGGGSEAVRAQFWRSMTFTGNTIYDDKRLISAADEDNRMKGWKWDGNTYYQPVAAANGKAFNGPGGAKTFDEWKALGYDSKSTWIPSKPTGSASFLYPNEHDPNRAMVVAYNWDKQPSIDVDLSKFLKRGDKFIVYNVLDYLGSPVAAGTYQGGPTKVKMLDDQWVGLESQTLIVLKQ